MSPLGRSIGPLAVKDACQSEGANRDDAVSSQALVADPVGPHELSRTGEVWAICRSIRVTHKTGVEEVDRALVNCHVEFLALDEVPAAGPPARLWRSHHCRH